MGFFGGVIGTALGKIGSHFLPIPNIDGGNRGSWIGNNLVPFRKGGRVKKAQQYKQKNEASMTSHKNKRNK